MALRFFVRRVVIALCALILCTVPFSSAFAADTDQPTLTQNQPSYLPGETIVLTGSNWEPGETVTVFVTADSADGGNSVQTVVGDNGSFNVSVSMPNVPTGDADMPSPQVTATASGTRTGSSVQVQFAVGHAATDAERMIDAEKYWNHRVTYPTGKFNPAWVRNAANQDRRMRRGLPGGRRRNFNRSTADGGTGFQSLATTLNSSNPNNYFAELFQSSTSFIALGPQPEHMSGCSGCYDYGTTSGRANDIVIDPTTTSNGSIVAYVGTVGGGVWKTTNCCSASTTWTVTTDDPLIATTAIDSLTIDPSNHNTIYAGTGDLNYGSFSMGSQGILKSTDGGGTWTVKGGDVFGPSYAEPAGNFPQYDAVGKVRVDPNNSSTIAAGTKKGLFISRDGGDTWTGPCTIMYPGQRQDVTGLDLSNISGSTRITLAVGVRGFATTVQYDLGNNGANGIYSATMPASGCPTFTSIARNDNGFVFGPTVTNAPYAAGAVMNAGSGTPYANATTGDQLGRIDIAVAPSNPSVIYAQVQSIAFNNNSGCGNTNGCQLGVWVSTDAGSTWSFMVGSAGMSLAACTGSAGGGDYPQNWYDQGIAVDPNNADRVFINTFDTWFATRTGTSHFDITCGYNGTPVANHAVHVDHHAQTFLPGNSDILLIGDDGGVHGTVNASVTTSSVRPTWFNMDGGLNTIEFYAGDIGPNFATNPTPTAVGGAQDNGPSSVMFTGAPTGGAQWQMGLGGDGFSGQIDPMGTGSTQAQGTITLTTGGATAGQTFVIGSQTFTFAATRTVAGTVALNSSTTTEGNNIVTAINADIPTVATAARSGATVVVTATVGGSAGNSIAFANNNAANLSMNGGGVLGATTAGDDKGGPRFWEGNNSGGLSRCTSNCTQPGASWTSRRGAWTGDTQSFVLPINLFHGGIPGGDDCDAAGLTTGCGHLIAATTRVWETISGATGTNTWYVTNNPATLNLTKGTLGNRSFINQVKYSPKRQSVAIIGTNDGAVQFGFNLGTGTASQATWVDVTGGNAVLPNRPVLGIAVDPSTDLSPIGYAAVGGFNENTPTTPGHIFRVVCGDHCATSTWTDKTGNLPNIPVDSIIANPNFPQQVFAGTDFGLYFTDDITAQSPVWQRFSNVPAVMIWDMAVDRGATTLSLWTRGRGAYAWPLPAGPEQPLPTVITVANASGNYGTTISLTATLASGGNPVAGKTITFSVNGSPVGTAVTNSSGVATLSYTVAIGGGTWPLTASLAADNVYAAASATGTLTVTALPASLTPSVTLVKTASGYQATFTLTNTGGGTATNVNLTVAALGSASGTPIPQSMGDIAGGSSASVTVNFSASAGASGATVAEKYSGTYTGGTFTTSIRAKLP